VTVHHPAVRMMAIHHRAASSASAYIMQHGTATVIHVTRTIEQVPRAPVSSAAAIMTQLNVVAVALAGCITELKTLALWPS
jgi:hypothetical protein